MGIFDIFKAVRGEPIFGRCPRRFHGSAKKMGIILIEAWKAYCAKNPQFKPNDLSGSQYGERLNAFHQVCLKVGYPNEWASVLCLNKEYLGDLAYQLLCSDLLNGNTDTKKEARAVAELHQYFSEFLPDQLGELERQYERSKDEL